MRGARAVCAAVWWLALAVSCSSGGAADDGIAAETCADLAPSNHGISSKANALSFRCDGPVPDVIGDGQVACEVLGWTEAGTSFCDCRDPGYSMPTESLVDAARARIGDCEACFCALEQFSGEELTECRTLSEVEFQRPIGTRAGWCYVNPGIGLGEDGALDYCGVGFRALGENPPPGAVVLCQSSGP